MCIFNTVFIDSVVNMPEKLTVYTTLVGLLNAKNYTCGGEVKIIMPNAAFGIFCFQLL